MYDAPDHDVARCFVCYCDRHSQAKQNENYTDSYAHGIGVSVGVGELVGVSVGVGELVGVSVGVGVLVGVAVGIGVTVTGT